MQDIYLLKNRLTALHNENGKVCHYVDSKVVFNGKVIDSKIRLKVLWKDTEDPIKWSLRLNKEDKIL